MSRCSLSGLGGIGGAGPEEPGLDGNAISKGSESKSGGGCFLGCCCACGTFWKAGWSFCGPYELRNVVVASGEGGEAVEALVGNYVGHMAVVVADKIDELSGLACLIARSIGRGREISVRQDSCHSLIVAAHIVHVAERQVSEAGRQNIDYGILQVVRKCSVVVAMPDCGHFEAYDVCFVDLRLATEAEEDRLIHIVVTSLLMYFPRPISGVLVEACWYLASQQASSHLDVVWEAVVVAQHDYH